MKPLHSLWMALFIVAGCSADKAPASGEKQLSNILIIYADDMGYGDLVIQNPNSKIPTPHLNQLAQECNEVVRGGRIHNTFAGDYVIRQGDWVVVNVLQAPKNRRNKTGNPKWETKHHYPEGTRAEAELYNLRKDIGQRNNLAAQYPEKITSMVQLLKQIQEQGYSAPRLSK